MSNAAPKSPYPTKDITINSYEDNFPLGCTMVFPEVETTDDDPLVIIAPATAVPRKFYIPYMWFLASHKIISIALDWKGTHSSLDGSKQDSKATLTVWGTQNLAGVIQEMRKMYPNKKLVQIGHSAGGHVMPMPHNRNEISHAITVGTQNAFYPLTPYRYRYSIFWNVIVPSTTQIFGYYPGTKIGIIGDLPTPIMQEWRSWAYNPFYVCGVEGFKERYATYDRPVLAISIDDDEFATEMGVQLFHQSLGSGRNVTFWHVDHSEVAGKKPIGHIGFFSRQFAKTLWPKTVEYILTGKLLPPPPPSPSPSSPSLTPSPSSSVITSPSVVSPPSLSSSYLVPTASFSSYTSISSFFAPPNDNNINIRNSNNNNEQILMPISKL